MTACMVFNLRKQLVKLMEPLEQKKKSPFTDQSFNTADSNELRTNNRVKDFLKVKLKKQIHYI